MKLTSVCAPLCLALLLAGARIASAQQVQPLEPEWLRQMYEEGWQKVQEGVLQRDTGGGKLETFGYGAEGLQWVLQVQEQRRALLEARYAETPTRRLADQIDQVKAEIARIDGAIESSSSVDNFDNAAMATCSPVFDGSASAGPVAEGWGAEATASASFLSSCGQLADTSATAYAHAIEGTLESTRIQSHPRNGGSNLKSLASAQASGTTGCESWAQASVTSSELGISYLTPLRQSFACAYNTSIYTLDQRLDNLAWPQTGSGTIGPLSLIGSGATLIYRDSSLAGISFPENSDAMLQSQAVNTVPAFANAPVIILEYQSRPSDNHDYGTNPGSIMGVVYRSGLIQWGVDLRYEFSAYGPYLVARSYVGTTSTNDPAQFHVAWISVDQPNRGTGSYRWVWTESGPGSATGTGQWWVNRSNNGWQAWGAEKAGLWRPLGHASSRLLLREGTGSTNRLVLDLLEARVTIGTLP